jgi:hypothetical protein
MIRPILHHVLPVCLALAILPPIAAQTAITFAKHSVCTNSEGLTTCEQKLSVQVPVSYADRAQLEVAYIDTLITASGETTSLEETLTFKITKSEPLFLYPLRYLHTVRTLSAAGGSSYLAYAIDTPRRNCAITCDIWKGPNLYQTFSVSPSVPTVQFTTGHVGIASLTGEALAPLPAPDLSSHTLYVASDATTVADGLLVPRDQAAAIVDARQLDQLKAQDQALVAANSDTNTRYLVRNMLRFRSAVADMTGRFLAVRSPEICHSQLSFALDNAQIGVDHVESAGYMPYVYISNYESLSGQGIMHVEVKNQGQAATDYQIVVRDGYPDALPVVPAVGVALEAGAQIEILIPVPGTEDVAESAYYFVDLKSPQGTLYDSVQIYYDRTKLVQHFKR